MTRDINHTALYILSGMIRSCEHEKEEVTSPSTGMVQFVSSVYKFKSNHKVPVQVQVEPKDFSGFGLVWVWQKFQVSSTSISYG